MSHPLTRPVRGGLAIVSVALVAGSALLVMAIAPGGWERLPLVLWFRSLFFFERAGVLGTPVVLAVAALAALDARRPDAPGVPLPLRRRLWTPRRFALALLLPPLTILTGDRLLNGFEGTLVGPPWTDVYLVALGLCCAFWLASAFHAFRSGPRCSLWILAGTGIVLSVGALPAPRGFFFERSRARCADGTEVLFLRRTDESGSWEARGFLEIARVRWERFGLTGYEALVVAEWFWSDGGFYGPDGPLLVRPEGFIHDPDDDILRGFAPDALFVSGDGLVAVVGGDMRCTLAYDTRTGTRYGEYQESMFPYLGKGMDTLAPFRLLDAGGRPAESDIRSLEEKARRKAAELVSKIQSFDEPTLLALQENRMVAALDSPNPLVREAARRVIRAGGEALYPVASGRVR